MDKMLVSKKGKSPKTWAINVERMTATITFGRIGARPRVTRATFKHGHELAAYVVRKIDEKRRRGYTPVRLAGAR